MTALDTFLFSDFLGTATWLWLVFLAVVFSLLAFDLGVLHRDNREIGVKESLLLSAGYITAGLLFGLWVFFQKGGDASMDYLTGFLIEKSLSMDNVFLMAMIFSFLAIRASTSTRCCSGESWGDRPACGDDRSGRGADPRVQLDPLRVRRVPGHHRREDAVLQGG